MVSKAFADSSSLYVLYLLQFLEAKIADDGPINVFNNTGNVHYYF